MKTISTSISSIFFTLSAISAICHLFLLITTILHRRHQNSSSFPSSDNVTNNRSRGNRPRTKKNISSYFYISFWFSLIVTLIIRFIHDGPSIMSNGHVYGSHAASVTGWFNRCSFYSSLFNIILMVFSAYCNRLNMQNRSSDSTTIRYSCFTSRLRSTLAALFSWLISIVLATIVKLLICEYQFDPIKFGYICGYSIPLEKSSSRLKVLIYLDGILLGISFVWLIYGNWIIRKISLKNRTRIDQAQSMISDASFGSNLDRVGLRWRQGKLGNHSNRTVALSFVFIIRNICYLLNLTMSHNRWHFLIFSIIDFLYISVCPLIYIFFTKSMRDVLFGFFRRQHRNQRQAGREIGIGEDEHSLFSFSHPTASSASVEYISINKQHPEKSPFTRESPSNSTQCQESPEVESACDLGPHRNPLEHRISSGRYFNENRSKSPAKRDSPISYVQDPHRSDIYTISSFQYPTEARAIVKLTPETRRKSVIDKNLDAVLNTRRDSQFPNSNSKTSRRPIRYFQTDQNMDRSDQANTDVDSAVSETSSLKMSRGLISSKKKSQFLKRQDSMVNYETDGSLKERAAAARRFVEAYEAVNSRFQHSLAPTGDCPRYSSFIQENFSPIGLSAIDEGGFYLKKMITPRGEEQQTGNLEKRCYQDG